MAQHVWRPFFDLSHLHDRPTQLLEVRGGNSADAAGIRLKPGKQVIRNLGKSFSSCFGCACILPNCSLFEVNVFPLKLVYFFWPQSSNSDERENRSIINP